MPCLHDRLPQLSQVTTVSSSLYIFRLNAVTGWCGQQEAFTYVSVDLGSIHRVKAILVKVTLQWKLPFILYFFFFDGLPYRVSSQIVI